MNQVSGLNIDSKKNSHPARPEQVGGGKAPHHGEQDALPESVL